MIPVALTIAGSDPSGGAGLQADLKTFHRFGVYGMSVVTLLTVQNTRHVMEIQIVEPSFIVAQLRAVLDDIPPQAIKTGALGTAAIIETIAREAATFPCPLVVDPVMISKHGDPLMDAKAVQVLKEQLLPRATLLTPNLHEAEALVGHTVDSRQTMEDAARALADLGPNHVLIKGGHLEPEGLDLLYSDGAFTVFPTQKILTPHTHGTGCAFGAAITALLARGETLVEACGKAKQFIQQAISNSPGLGGGCGPIGL